MSSRRAARAAELVHAELSLLLRREVKDPRLSAVSITHVHLNRDLSKAWIHVSPFAGKADATRMLDGLRSASGFLRSKLGRRLSLRHAPALEFVLDEGIDEAVRMTSMLEEMARAREAEE